MQAAEPVPQTYKDKSKLVSEKPGQLNLEVAADNEFRFKEHAEKVV